MVVYNFLLALESQGAATAVRGRSIESILDVVDTCGVAGIGNGADVLAIHLAGCNFVSV